MVAFIIFVILFIQLDFFVLSVCDDGSRHFAQRTEGGAVRPQGKASLTLVLAPHKMK